MEIRIGELQRVPEERIKNEGFGEETLYVGSNLLSGNLNSVKISNRNESGDKITHEIGIEGKNGYVGRALVSLVQILGTMKSMEEKMESETKQEMERVQKEKGKVCVVFTPEILSKEQTPEKRLPEYDLKVRRSRFYDIRDIQATYFIVKGIEKEDIAIKPPLKIEVENGGDFVTVSKENLQPLIEELQKLSQLPS